MAAPLLVRVSITFLDRGGRKSVLSFLFPASVSPQSAIAWAIDTAPIVQGLSDAVPLSAKYEYRHMLDDIGAASFTSDARRKAFLYYRNGDEIEQISIPSPRSEIFESEGPYAGVRVDASAEAVLSFNAVIRDSPSGFQTPEGEPLPDEYDVGGLGL